MNIGVVLSFFGGAWKLFSNAGTILGFIGIVEDVVKRSLASPNKLPSCEDTHTLMSAVSDLFKKGVIDIPGVDETAVATGIDSVRDNLKCAVDVGHRNIAAYGDVKGRPLIDGGNPPPIVEDKKNV